MTWSKVEGIHLNGRSTAQDLYKGYAIFLDEYPVDHMCGYNEARDKFTHHNVGYWKVDPKLFSGWVDNRATKKISSDDYGLRHLTAVYNNFLITFGTRLVLSKEESVELNMFVLNLDCKNICL